MEALGTFILAAFALEAAMEILRNIWDASVRSVWNFTRLSLFAVALVTVVVFSDWNIVRGTGIDLNIEMLGRVITALALAHGVYWVHEGYKRIERPRAKKRA
ncbi:MAG: hypothetical protein ACRDFQ_10140 [Anaerolineales bacterium]